MRIGKYTIRWWGWWDCHRVSFQRYKRKTRMFDWLLDLGPITVTKDPKEGRNDRSGH